MLLFVLSLNMSVIAIEWVRIMSSKGVHEVYAPPPPTKRIAALVVDPHSNLVYILL